VKERHHLEEIGILNNIKMNLKEIYDWFWTGFIWRRIATLSAALVNTVINLRVPYNTENLLTS
jgi:hypothetical protein